VYKDRYLNIALDLMMAVLPCHLHVSLFEHCTCHSLDIAAARLAAMNYDLHIQLLYSIFNVLFAVD